MKKVLVILISTMFAISLCSCGDTEQRSYDEEPWGSAEDLAEQQEYEEDLRIYDEMMQAHPDAISWESASEHEGEYITVYGTVKDVDSESTGGDPTFVDVGGAYPDARLTGVIWPECSSLFPNVNELEGAFICMSGTIYMYKGNPNIELTDASQIDVIDSADSSDSGEIGDYSLDEDTGISYEDE